MPGSRGVCSSPSLQHSGNGPIEDVLDPLHDGCRWRSGTITTLNVKRATPGEGSLKTPRKLFPEFAQWPDDAVMARSPSVLNRLGLRSGFGRS
jgi:hypothetical protein